MTFEQIHRRLYLLHAVMTTGTGKHGIVKRFAAKLYHYKRLLRKIGQKLHDIFINAVGARGYDKAFHTRHGQCLFILAFQNFNVGIRIGSRLEISDISSIAV